MCSQFGHYARECPFIFNVRQSIVPQQASNDNRTTQLYSCVNESPKQLQGKDILKKGAASLRRTRRIKRGKGIEVGEREKTIRKDTFSHGESMMQQSTNYGQELVREQNTEKIVSASEKDSNKESDQITAAFTVVKVNGKQLRALADTGASHSIVALSWLEHLKLKKLVIPSSIKLIDAQKESIAIDGEVVLPVEFGNKIFYWKFAVASKLFCPIIIGMNILHKGRLDFHRRIIEVQGEIMPVTFSLKELKQSTVVAAVNKVLSSKRMLKLKGRVMRDTISSSLL